MRLWLCVFLVAMATWTMKASGPLALGDRRLPTAVVRVTAMLAPALLAGLIIVDLGGAKWNGLDGQQVLGVGVAGVARMLKAPMLLAIVCGIGATALLRLFIS
jgi:branched-subunit amino acid transport protein